MQSTRADFTSSREHTSRDIPQKIPTVWASRRISDKLSLELSPTLHVFHIQFLGIRILQTPEIAISVPKFPPTLIPVRYSVPGPDYLRLTFDHPCYRSLPAILE